jgi:7-cyano-7-deazaguanine synthase in queuosine biosynthesis
LNVSTIPSANPGEVRFRVEHKGKSHAVHYSSEDTPLAPRPEAAVAGLLLVAMAAGEDLQVDAPLDAAFKGNIDTIQDVYATWTDALRRVGVIDAEAPETRRSARPDSSTRRGAAAFFSGGVDSFYTLLKHREDIDALIFVHGFDLKLDDRDLRAAVSEKLQAVADAYGKQLIEVETTLRTFTERKRMAPEFANWVLSHGSALASIAHVLSDQFERVYIPASHTYKNIYPLGSHPLLDPLWSASDLSVVYDGCEANRIDKCELIGQHSQALQSLRVCWKNTGEAYNCGRCEKCIRTMLILKALGVLDRSTSFKRDLTLRRVAGTWIRAERWERYYKEVLKLLEQDNRHPSLRAAIRTALYYSRLKRRARTVRQWITN